MNTTQKWTMAALCAFAVSVSAQAQKQMVVKLQGSETPLTYALSTISKATFLDGQISFTAADGEGDDSTTPTVIKAFALKDIETITFTDVTAGIGAVNATPTEKLSVNVSGNTLNVKGVTTPQTLTIYATTGQVVKQVTEYAGSGVNIATLQPGIYVVKVGSQATKFSK